MAAWLCTKGYEYLTDELVLLRMVEQPSLDAVYRPLNIKSDALGAITALLDDVNAEQKMLVANDVFICPAQIMGKKADRLKSVEIGMLIFPDYKKDAILRIEALTSAQTGLALMACNVNGRNFSDHGFNHVADIARRIPAIRLEYGRFEDIENTLPVLIELVISGAIDTKFIQDLNNPKLDTNTARTTSEIKRTIPQASALGKRKKLCIGMATYDDYDGVYFTSQAIRMYHQEVTSDTEILVLDNHPGSLCSAELKALDTKVKHYRYQPVMEKTGTAVRDMIFESTDAEYVLCLDCHVFIQPGAIAKLIAYFESNPDCMDLLQGPMYSDDLVSLSTHFNPVWNQGMYGVWALDQRGVQLDAPAFDIPMQGLGLFACRKKGWPGFNKQFHGFGGEEGYIHEKFRQAGARTLCLPFLRWAHRFARPLGVPYPINWADRIRNYLIGFTELGLATDEIISHFNDHLGVQVTTQVVQQWQVEYQDQLNL